MEEFFLAIEARRIRLAHQFDPMLVVSVSQVDPLPHQIEAVGMRMAREYVENRGWEVVDVSDKMHGGFDLRSIKIGEDGRIEDVRYIEVKARARSGAIRLSANE